jgi:DNA polymerase III delta prime subunit
VRYFNTSGPCVPGLHYMLPPEPRLPGARELIAQQRYFVVHAPRQTGKTTTLNALARDLTAEGKHVALRFSCERAAPTDDDYGAAGGAILEAIAEAAQALGLPTAQMPPSPWPQASGLSQLKAGLTAWARSCPLPIVLFFDEIDALRGQSLVSVLRQLRDGYTARPAPFPASVVLCGLRDVRDYRVAAGGDPERLGTFSPFNVSVKSLRIGDFTREQVAELYVQHTAETGQEFTPEAAVRAFDYSQGQPWLVNAIAWEITGEMRIKPPEPITAEHVDEAKDRLILARATHLDSLAARLNEPRVRKFIEPLLVGGEVTADPSYDDDLSYVRDLGLIRQSAPLAIANPIYKEVIVRTLGARARDSVTAEPRSFLLPGGKLDFQKVLEEFAAFWRERGEILAKGEVYHEVAPQLVFIAFLQRIVNGGGMVDCEYGIGRGRIDVLVRKPYTDSGHKAAVHREAVELKVRRPRQGNPLKDGLAQLDEYLSRLGLDSGTLMIFDRRPSALRKRPNPEISRSTTPEGRDITLFHA